jgi:Na+-transporting NADH:ubiquinone oxidoreductase subunit B
MMGWLHVRGNPHALRRRILLIQLLALLPVTLIAMINFGYQYLPGLQGSPEFDGGDLRGQLAGLLVLNADSPGIYDFFITGFAHLLPMFLLAFLVAGLWERINANRQTQPIQLGFVRDALLFTLLLPAVTPFTHVAIGMSFAMVIGKIVFGGEGKSFISPALFGVAILQVSFPGVSGTHPMWEGLRGYSGSDAIATYFRGGETELELVGIDAWSAFVGSVPGTLGTMSVLGVALGAGLLLLTRLISWRLLAAQFIGLLFFVWLLNAFSASMVMPVHWHILLGSFAFGAVFIACDPVASACTNPGRWIQGFLIAALLVLIRTANPTHPDAVIPVLLLASLLAPLIDHAVIAWDIRNRGRRHV